VDHLSVRLLEPRLMGSLWGLRRDLMQSLHRVHRLRR
jgi:hypothetical protein